MKSVKFVFDTLNILESEIRAAICTNIFGFSDQKKSINLLLEGYFSAEHLYYFQGYNFADSKNSKYTNPFKYDKTLKGSIVAAVSRSITHRLAINANRRSSSTFKLLFFLENFV